MIKRKKEVKEIWIDVKGFEGHYMVSNLGRVKSIKRGQDRILVPIKGSTASKGSKIKLYKDGVGRNMNVCTIVSNNFLDRQPNQMTRHFNGDINDNRVDNLYLINIGEEY